MSRKTLTQELAELEASDPAVAAAAESYDEAVERILTTFPRHYRDDEGLGVCSWSGAARLDEATCPNGCAGSKEHYANDGHPECES